MVRLFCWSCTEIGRNGGDGWSEYFAGIIDEAAAYDRALTPGEIQQHYQNGLLGLGYCDNNQNVGPANLWIGLKNSDDQGTQFDLRTELYNNDTLVGEGKTLCITGVTRNPSKAKEVSVPISSGIFTPEGLALRILTRIGTNPDGTKCSGPGGSHNNAVGLRLYYDAVSRPSRFSVAIAPDPLTDLFLHSIGTDFFLDDIPPSATSAKFKDSPAINFAGGNSWQEVGTWTLP